MSENSLFPDNYSDNISDSSISNSKSTSNLTNNLIPFFEHTDIGNAESFAFLFKNKIKYDFQRKSWFIWNNLKWKEDYVGEVYQLSKTLLRQRRNQAESISDTEKKNKEIKWLRKCEDTSRLDSMIRLAKTEKDINISTLEWDYDPLLIGVQNGTLDLRKGILIKPSPLHLITKSMNSPYFPELGFSDLWDGYLNYNFNNIRKEYLQKASGYSLTGLITEQVFFNLYGRGGTGKSIFVAIIGNLMGDYTSVMPFSAMEMNQRDRISNDLAALAGARFVWSSETQEEVRINEGRIKALTGDSLITARFLRKEFFTFKPKAKFWFAYNHKPKVIDDSGGFWRRVILLTMDNVVTREDRIKDLEERLMLENPLILNWMVQGCLKWQKEGLEAPKCISDEIQLYKEDMNPLSEFIEDELVIGQGYAVLNSEVWECYVDWCRKVGEKYPIGRKNFGRRLESMGFVKKRKGGDHSDTWLGIGLRGSKRNLDLLKEEFKQEILH